jgi:IclR family transcriptional regulator, KDG regulon repressor
MTEVKSLARGLEILDYVWNSATPTGISDLAQHLQIDKSSVSRLAHTLMQHGYLANPSGSRRLVPGARLIQISCELERRLALRQRARPHLSSLANQSGECAHIAIHDSDCAVVIEDVEVESSLRVVGGSGRRIPLYCTAVGKALMAFCELPAPELLKPITPRTITCHQALQKHLAEVRRQRYAVDDEEHEPGVRCMATAVFLGQLPIAVIGISGPTVRITDERIERLSQLLLEAAERLSKELLSSFQASSSTTERV